MILTGILVVVFGCCFLLSYLCYLLQITDFTKIILTFQKYRIVLFLFQRVLEGQIQKKEYLANRVMLIR